MTKTEIRRAIGEPDFSRGDAYYRQDRVQSVEIRSPKHLESMVLGTGQKIYRQTITLTFTPGGDLRRVVGECSCPVGFNCKHVAAALLHAAAQVGPGGKAAGAAAPVPAGPPSDPLSGDMRFWLEDLSDALESGAAKIGPVRYESALGTAGMQATEERLFYVFRSNSRHQAEISPYQVRLKKDGTAGANAREYGHRPSAGHAKFLTMEDTVILTKLDYFSQKTWPPSHDWPEGETLLNFLREVVGTGCARAGDVRGPVLEWGPPRRVHFAWAMNESGDQEVQTCSADGAGLTLLPFPSLVYLELSNGLIGLAETDFPAPLAVRIATAPPVPPEASALVAGELARIGGVDAPKPRALEVRQRTDLAPQAVLTLYGMTRKLPATSRAYLRGAGIDEPAGLTYPCARLEIRYEGAPEGLQPGRGGDPRIVTKHGVTVLHRRLGEENLLADRFKHLAARHDGYPPGFYDFEGRRIPKGLRQAGALFPAIHEGEDGAVASALGFATEAVPELRQEGWRVEIEESWPFRLYEGPAGFGAGIETTGQDWFSVSLKLEAGDQEIDLTGVILSIIDALPVNARGELEDGFDVGDFLSDQVLYPVLGDGSMVRIEGARLAPFVAAFLEVQGLLEFHRAEAGRIATLAEALEGCGAPWRGGRDLLEFGERLRVLAAAPEIQQPSVLQGVLRPYQRLGYGWLRALCDSGFGGALADDMGLGKTIQALALLAHRHLEIGTDRPSLLVAPTSLLGNWVREAARFTPGLKLLVLQGPDRQQRFAEIPGQHLVLTTYPLLNRDHEALFSHDYDLVILDEAQAVKNPASAAAKRIRQISARQRIALTGTPMENNLGELWALYDWLVPGLLGDRKSFNKMYRTPIEKHGDQTKQRILSTRLKPFLLRRRKDEVASDLPPKTEIDEIVPITGAQRALYESVRTAMDERVREAIRAKGISGSRITILDALLKLRQVCCDPALVKLNAAKDIRESAKRARLFELLEELTAEGRKVLVFSQFVQMLRLIEQQVRKHGWSYAMLHGGTTGRDKEIDKFQQGDASLFLISLKAGGLGLNLTAADTVILYDPWWNPAVERQAMDRAHRIGQDKPVFVHRLIVEGSVESAIQEMQVRKQALADALFEGGGDGPMALTQDDLNVLLTPIS